MSEERKERTLVIKNVTRKMDKDKIKLQFVINCERITSSTRINARVRKYLKNRFKNSFV